MGTETLKNRTRRALTIDNELDKWLNKYIEKTGVARTKAIDRALLLLKKELEESGEYRDWNIISFFTLVSVKYTFTYDNMIVLK